MVLLCLGSVLEGEEQGIRQSSNFSGWNGLFVR